MANADFNPKQTGIPGGFDAGSYREKASPEQAVQLTPLQQKLAGLEAKLPAALTRQAVALALSIVVMLAAFAGFGGAKVRSITTRPGSGSRWACLPTTATTSARN